MIMKKKFSTYLFLKQCKTHSLSKNRKTKGFKENFNWDMIKEFLSDMLVEEQENKGKSSLKSKYLVWDEDVNK